MNGGLQLLVVSYLHTSYSLALLQQSVCLSVANDQLE